MAAVKTTSSLITRRFSVLVLMLLLLAALALLTGLALRPYYRPTTTGAYLSVQALAQSPLLRIVQGVHHWASALLLVIGAIAILYSLLTAAYRRPWHLAWVSVIGLLLLCLLFQLTGHLLPWDRNAVRTAVIETGIAANAPAIGPLQAKLLRDGDSVGPATLSTWYLAHIALLPFALLLLGGLIVRQMRQLKVMVKSGTVALAVTGGLLLLMALVLKPPFGPAATTADYNSYAAPPEWYVLPLHSLLTLAQRVRPDFGFLGTMMIPGLALAALVALPWIDRRSVYERPSHRVRGAAAFGALGFATLLALSAREAAPIVHGASPALDQAAFAEGAPTLRLDPALVARGQKLFTQNGCMRCHRVNGQGFSRGPELDGEGTRHPTLDWQMQHLQDPGSVVEGSTMPSFSEISADKLRALASYLLSLK